jgi:hypothetical protein
MLDSIWQFLKELSNIPSIGAGIAVLGGAWAVFTFFARKSEKDPPASDRNCQMSAIIARLPCELAVIDIVFEPDAMALYWGA